MDAVPLCADDLPEGCSSKQPVCQCSPEHTDFQVQKAAHLTEGGERIVTLVKVRVQKIMR